MSVNENQLTRAALDARAGLRVAVVEKTMEQSPDLKQQVVGALSGAQHTGNGFGGLQAVADVSPSDAGKSRS